MSIYHILDIWYNPFQSTFYHKKNSLITQVYREYSTDEGDPYYPVPNKRNKDLYKKYQVLRGQDLIFLNDYLQSMAEKEPGVKFVGRLASYKYFNMDQVNILRFYNILIYFNISESPNMGYYKYGDNYILRE